MKALNNLDLLDKLDQLHDGELCLSGPSGQQRFYLLDGQLLYASDKLLAVRRFRRAARYYRPSWKWSTNPAWSAETQSWEILLLERALSLNQLSPIQVKLILRTVLQECLFELMHDDGVTSEWRDVHLEVSSAYRSAALSGAEVKRIIHKTESMHQAWQAGPLGNFRLSMSPVVADGRDAASFRLPAKYLQGTTDLWDVLQTQTSSLEKLNEHLFPMVESGAVALKAIPDLPLPLDDEATSTPSVEIAAGALLGQEQNLSNDFAEQSSSLGVSATSSQPALIACIDDSPVLTQSLKKILTAAGYRTLSIPEPMRGFAKLIDHRPDLILLDLMLPNADGYSVCKFLRETPLFEKTPIIILTGQDSSLDRLRAKLVGATEFLTKPPQPEALLKMIEMYLA